VRVLVETLFARIDGETVRAAAERREVAGDESPNLVARAVVAERYPSARDEAVVHSTSWRYVAGEIVLTYLVYWDHIPKDDLTTALPIRRVVEEGSDSIADPGDVEQVAIHAVRHLAFLVKEDPEKYEGKIRTQALVALQNVAPDVFRELVPTEAT
jgi:hypothetical protein